jgi:hypothetical protein
MMEDRTGEPRSDKEVQEAIDVVTEIAVKHPMALPMFTVHAMPIRDCLRELQERRRYDG